MPSVSGSKPVFREGLAVAQKKSGQRRATKGKRGTERRSPKRSQSAVPAGSPTSVVREDLLAYARHLRANAKEAEKYSPEEIDKRLGGRAKKNTNTYFATRTNRLAHELRARDSEFATLVARCLTRDPCRPIIDTLVEAGLRDWIQVLISAFESIGLRAGHMLDAESRKQLDDDLAQVCRMVASLAEVASWVMSKARAIGDEDMPAAAQPAELPEPLMSLVLSSREKAGAFLHFLAERPPAFRRSNQETTLAWLRHIQEEKQRIETETKAFMTLLTAFTGEHVDVAAASGGEVLLRFMEKREGLIRQVAAIRNTSILLTESVIARVIRGLSLDDGDGEGDGDGDGSGSGNDGLHAASRIIFSLKEVSAQLDDQKRQLVGVAQDATAERMAAVVKQADLPVWEEIHGTGNRTDTGVRAIWMLLRAFQDPDNAQQTFTTATANELLGRLNALPIARDQRFSDTWVFRRLREAEKLKIVFRRPRAEGQKKTTPDVFQLCKAAIRKFGGKFTAR